MGDNNRVVSPRGDLFAPARRRSRPKAYVASSEETPPSSPPKEDEKRRLATPPIQVPAPQAPALQISAHLQGGTPRRSSDMGDGSDVEEERLSARSSGRSWFGEGTQKSPRLAIGGDEPSKALKKLDKAVEEALQTGNTTYLINVLGPEIAIVEFALKMKRDAVRTMLEQHPELVMDPKDIVPHPGVPFSDNNTRHLTAQEYAVATRTYQEARMDMQADGAFAERDLKLLTTIYATRLHTGVIEACKRHEEDIAIELCCKWFQRMPIAREKGVPVGAKESDETRELCKKVQEEARKRVLEEERKWKEEEDKLLSGSSCCTIA